MYGVLRALQEHVAQEVVRVLLSAIALCVCSVAALADSAVMQAARLPPERDFIQVGTSSWYGEWHHGRITANGERFDMHAMTAAHRFLPLGTFVRVTNLSNQKSVMLRVNDRGPYIHGRVLDVSFGAAQQLGFVEDGLAPVRIMTIPAPVPKPVPRASAVLVALPVSKPFMPDRGGPSEAWRVQIAALWNHHDAETEWQRLARRYGSLLHDHAPRIEQHWSNGRDVYRLKIGAFAGRQIALNVCRTLKDAGQDCLVVR